MRVVLVGPPGSGKGTQGPVLAEHLRVPHLSTGDLLRAQVGAGTDLGHRVGEVIDRGELVPDDLMIAVLADAVGNGATGGYVLDGFPRTVAQADMLEQDGSPLAPPDLALHLDIPDAAVHERLAQRRARRGAPTTPTPTSSSAGCRSTATRRRRSSPTTANAASW